MGPISPFKGLQQGGGSQRAGALHPKDYTSCPSCDHGEEGVFIWMLRLGQKTPKMTTFHVFVWLAKKCARLFSFQRASKQGWKKEVAQKEVRKRREMLRGFRCFFCNLKCLIIFFKLQPFFLVFCHYGQETWVTRFIHPVMNGILRTGSRCSANFIRIHPQKTNGWIPKMMGLGKGGSF